MKDFLKFRESHTTQRETAKLLFVEHTTISKWLLKERKVPAWVYGMIALYKRIHTLEKIIEKHEK